MEFSIVQLKDSKLASLVLHQKTRINDREELRAGASRKGYSIAEFIAPISVNEVIDGLCAKTRFVSKEDRLRQLSVLGHSGDSPHRNAE